MNLIAEPWIPVVFENGKSGQAGLQELFRNAESIRDLNANPPQRIALMRLLICITQAALDGPENKEDWKNCRDRIIPASLDYLAARHDKFNLYGDHPFLQAKGAIAKKKTKKCPVDILDQCLSSKNNHTLFDHESTPVGRMHDDDWIALMILTFQCFALGGGISSEFHWNGMSFGGKGNNFEAAPCAEHAPLHMIFRGINMLVTLHLNLLTKQQVPNWGLPIWDVAGKSDYSNDLVSSYLGRLVPVSRLLLCKKNSSLLEVFTQGFKYPKLPEYREPMIPLVLRNDEPTYMPCSCRHEPWRELSSLISTTCTVDEYLPLAIAHEDLRDECIDIWTGGVDSNQAQPVIALEWNFSTYHGAVFGDDAVIAYSTGVQRAEKQSKRFRWAVDRYRELLGDEIFKKKKNGKYARSSKRERTTREKLISDSNAIYWNQLSASFDVLISAVLSSPVDCREWNKLLWRASFEALATACPHETPRQIQAYAKAKKLLRIKEKKDASAS